MGDGGPRWRRPVVPWAFGLGLLRAVVCRWFDGSTTGATTSPVISHLTIVQENGLGVAAILSIPLVATAIVAVALRRRRRSESRGPGPVAVGLTAAVGVFVCSGRSRSDPRSCPCACCSSSRVLGHRVAWQISRPSQVRGRATTFGQGIEQDPHRQRCAAIEGRSGLCRRPAEGDIVRGAS